MTRRVRQERVQASLTPVRAALRSQSPLRAQVEDGLDGVEKAHRIYFDKTVRSSFADSLNLDVALARGHERENRWDYLLGHAPSHRVMAVEAHSAENKEIATVIKKREAALRQLREHLRDGKSVAKWLWVASGNVHFAPMEKATFQLAQSGIEFVGRTIMNKHLA